jgi:hypothetical protein
MSETLWQNEMLDLRNSFALEISFHVSVNDIAVSDFTKVKA